MKLILIFTCCLQLSLANAQINHTAIPKLETKFIKMDHIIADSLGEYLIETSNPAYANKNLKIKDLKLPRNTVFYFQNDSAAIVDTNPTLTADAQTFIACCWFFRDYYRVPVLIKTTTCLSVNNDHILYKLGSKSSLGKYQVSDKKNIYKTLGCFEVIIRVPAYVTCRTCVSTHCSAIVNVGGMFYSFPISQPQQSPDNQGQLAIPCGNCPPGACQSTPKTN